MRHASCNRGGKVSRAFFTASMSITWVCAAITGSRAALPEVLHAVRGACPAGCLPFPAASALRREAALPVTAPGTALARRRAQREGQFKIS